MSIISPSLSVQTAAFGKCWCHIYISPVNMYTCKYSNVCICIYIYINMHEEIYTQYIYTYITSYICQILSSNHGVPPPKWAHFQQDLPFQSFTNLPPPPLKPMPGTTSSPPSPRNHAAVRRPLPRPRPSGGSLVALDHLRLPFFHGNPKPSFLGLVTHILRA